MAWVTKSSEEHYDAPQEPQHVYTRSEKAKNWWYYHKWAVLIGALVLFCAAWVLHDALSQETPDYRVAWVGQASLPDDTVTALQDALAQYGTDLDGDGQVTVRINQYILDLSSQNDDQGMDPYNKMAGMTRLSADMSEGVNQLYLLEDPEGFVAMTGALLYLDGSQPADGASDWQNMVYRWSDCPVLAGLDLGSYALTTATGETAAGSQELLSGVYVGHCGAWSDTQVKNQEGGEEFWQALTAGASAVEAAG